MTLLRSNTIPALATVLLALSAAACTEPLDLESAPRAGSPLPAADGEPNTAARPQYDAVLRWNAGYTATDGVLIGGYSTVIAPIGPRATLTQQLPHPPTATLKGYGANAGQQVFAYVEATGVTWLQINGSDLPLWLNPSTLFTYPIEEIEVHPVTHDVYALARVGNAVKLYRFDADGMATLMTYGTTGAVFYNPLGNGYKSGSICFVPSGPGTYNLALTTESTVYANLGLVVWQLQIVGNGLVPATSLHRTYSTSTSGIPGAQTGQLNTAYGEPGSGNKIYLARDNGVLYQLDLSASNLPAVAVTAGPIPIVNDAGYWRAF